MESVSAREALSCQMVVRKGPMGWFPLATGNLELEKVFYGVTLLTIYRNDSLEQLGPPVNFPVNFLDRRNKLTENF